MDFINNIKKRAKENIKTIVLPESMDDRVLEAAEIVLNENIANLIIIGDETKIENSKYNLEKATIINPETDINITEKINKLVEIRKNKGLSFDEAKNFLLNDYMYYACMLVKENKADGIVSGACHSTSNTLRPALQIIKTKKDVPLVSAFFLMDVPNCIYGENGVFIFADSGLVQDPTAIELADIAKSSSDSFETLVNKKAIIAMLSHSTKGSAKHPLVDKMVDATRIAHEKYPNLLLDGELQVDAAIVPEIADSKAPDSKINGRANVLIFPNLDAGNIGYKLVQRLANAKAYGPICQGIAAPVNDLSRGCNALDIVGVVAITAVQSQNN